MLFASKIFLLVCEENFESRTYRACDSKNVYIVITTGNETKTLKNSRKLEKPCSVRLRVYMSNALLNRKRLKNLWVSWMNETRDVDCWKRNLTTYDHGMSTHNEGTPRSKHYPSPYTGGPTFEICTVIKALLFKRFPCFLGMARARRWAIVASQTSPLNERNVKMTKTIPKKTKTRINKPQININL